MRNPALNLCSGASPRQGSDRAMTLIELMVVMGIITLLTSVLVVAAFAFQRQAQVKGTASTLALIGQGIVQYKTTYGMYPPEDVDYSTVPVWFGVEAENSFIPVAAKYKGAAGTYTDPDTGVVKPRFQYVDAWRAPLKYSCPAPFQSCRIWSFGPDLVDSSGDEIVQEE